jgi:hypothetical protein
MRLFQILTRLVDAGKMKVTRTLLDRVNCETGGKRGLKPPKPHRRRRGGFTRSLCAALEAAMTLPIWLVTAQAVTGGQPRESSIATSGYSAVALFNQANAYARAGKPGLAILGYERARLLAPNDADIAANLRLVRGKAGLPDAPEDWFSRSLTCACPNTFAWLGSFGLVLAGMCMLLVRLHPQRRLAFRALTFVGALLVATAIGSAITMWPRVHEAVVIAGEAPARTSPVSFAGPAFKLREGETVRVRAEHQDFALVQTSAGRSGWAARADLGLVVPQFSSHPQ